eukprot:GDKI01034038.1.p1 GENE.GDKI01034038.1~~GDKI01034038.1.p1  ORF type:complete len:242 (-),score=67.06 GDKI01034038.1:197-922(-)
MYDPEAGTAFISNDYIDDKTDAAIRRGFVRKVYGILAVQLAITVAIAAPLVYSAKAQMWLAANMWVLGLAVATTLITMLVMVCIPSTARSFPGNFIMLFLFTASEGLLVGVAASAYTVPSVILALSMTVLITLGLTVYAFTTKDDFTGAGPYLFAFLWGMIIFGFFLFFFPSPFAHKLYAGMGAILFCMYIVYDTQLIMGGRNHRFQFGVDDYVFAALNIYLDIIQLFLYLLKLFGERRRN